MTVDVLSPGLSTTVQDLGRQGLYHLGIPQSGAMDRYSFRCANALVGNEPEAAALEMTLLAPTLLFRDRRRVAITGADVSAEVDGEAVPPWSSFVVDAGQTVSFSRIRGGVRAYLAIAGGIDVPVVFGSRSTSRLNAIGGLEGRPLKAGDRLHLHPAPAPGASTGTCVLPDGVRPPEPRPRTELRMMTGMYWHRILESSGLDFFSSEWKITQEADRTAIRFGGGAPLDFVEREAPFGAGSDPSNVVDCGYPYGCIQVPGGTQPIVLHRDAVSGGGYFMLGVVISADMDVLARLRPGNTVQFRPVELDEALAARAEETRRTRRMYADLVD